MLDDTLARPVPSSRSLPRPASAIRRTLALLGPNFSLGLLFIATLLGLVAAYGASIRWKEGPIVISSAVALTLTVIAVATRARRLLGGDPGARAELAATIRRVLYDWGPLILVVWMFESLETYTGVVRKTAIDDQLYKIDVWLFGVEPTVWAGKLYHPLLTDWMSFSYAAYFIMPVILGIALFARGRSDDFREMVGGVIVQFGVGFIVCLILPAGPPRHYAPFLQGVFNPAHLTSLTGLYELQQGAFDTADPVMVRSAFPSLHCSMALLTMIYAWRFGDAVSPRHRRIFASIISFVVVSLWLSTIYLRHHWVPDIAAGFVLGGIAYAVASWLRRVWPRREELGAAADESAMRQAA